MTRKGCLHSEWLNTTVSSRGCLGIWAWKGPKASPCVSRGQGLSPRKYAEKKTTTLFGFVTYCDNASHPMYKPDFSSYTEQHMGNHQ